ncbi:MAG: NYN domain-containing protein [Defluviitaleaceae bacterium]|nr:NYN domain-containing protein [Defluviitaleaceae bacterium]
MQYIVTSKEESFEKVRTAVFVDYEAWFYGCKNQYQTEPDVVDWFNNLKDKGQIDDVFFFADFSHDAIKDHIMKLRNISNSIIDCSKGDKSKEYTDFIMLDHIYQRLFRQGDIKQFVLFTGDSHFQSVVAFLRNFNEKKVGIYALDGSLSPLLAEACDWYVKVIPSSGRFESIKKALLKNLTWICEKPDAIPTFSKTVSIVVRNYPEYSEADVANVLSTIIAKGLVRQEETLLPHSGQTVKKLVMPGVMPVKEEK